MKDIIRPSGDQRAKETENPVAVVVLTAEIKRDGKSVDGLDQGKISHGSGNFVLNAKTGRDFDQWTDI